MKISASSLVTALLSAVTATASCAQAAAPSPPTLTHLYTMNCTIGASISIGQGPIYNRVALPIVGGTFSGPKLSGTIANLGADWGITGSDGVFHPDTRYHLYVDSQEEGGETAGVFVQTVGSAQPDGLIHLKMSFETGSKEFWWLNNAVAIGILQPGEGWVVIDAWQIVSPAKA